MISKEQLEEIIANKINNDECTGYQKGAGDHVGHIDCSVKEIEEPVKAASGWKVSYSYVTTITTEFTIYPDKPPYEYLHKKTLVLNNDGRIISETEKISTLISGGFSDDEIESFINNDFDDD